MKRIVFEALKNYKTIKGNLVITAKTNFSDKKSGEIGHKLKGVLAKIS
jgi:hypothetical protein